MNTGRSTAVLDGRTWKLSLQPQHAALFKRIFDGVEKSGQQLLLSDTPRHARDLLWFADRHPLDFEPLMHVLAQADVQLQRETSVERILSSEYVPSSPKLAIPLRDYQVRAGDLAFANGGLLLGDDVGLGKQQPVDAKVLTPVGWREIGSLRVGDHVIGSNGQPASVTGVFPQGVKPSYRMKFSDGSSVESGPEHLWTMAYRRGGKRWAEMVLTTEQIRTGATLGNLSLAKTKLYLPMLSGPVQFADPGPLPIPPYTVGQLLANGSMISHGVALTTNTRDWLEIGLRIFAEGATIGAVHHYGMATRAGIIGVSQAVRDLGMGVRSGEKRIPPMYLRASVEARIALLQGLMDGDGSCSAVRNKVTFHTTSSGLAEDVRDLVEQLGGVGRIHSYDRSHDNKPTDYLVQIRTPLSIDPFYTQRKASRLADDRRLPRRTVVGVEYVRDVESVCIRVDAEDSLYVTERCILTHNTGSAIGLFARREALPAVVVTLTALPSQWCREIKKFAPDLRSHAVKQSQPYPLDMAKGKRVPIPDVVVMSYSKLNTKKGRTWVEKLTEEGLVKTVVFDEAQELRNNDSDRYRSARILRDAASYCLGLTATPVFNHGAEIHNVVDIMQPGALGARIEFLREWCGRGDSAESMQTHGTGEMRKIRVKDPIALGAHLREIGVMLRRTRTDVGRELPPLSRVMHTVDVDHEVFAETEASLEKLCRALLYSSDKTERFTAAGELDWQMRRATGLAKAMHGAHFVRMLVESGEKVVLYAWHHEVYDLLRKVFTNPELGDLKPAFFTGRESVSAKDRERRRFIEGDTDLLVMSLRAGAGLDGLQFVSKTAVFLELDWSPAVHEQAEGRVFRDGQPHPVMAYYLVTDEGSDPVVLDALNLKTEQSEGIRNLTGEVARLQGSEEHMRKVALAYLRKKGRLH